MAWCDGHIEISNVSAEGTKAYFQGVENYSVINSPTFLDIPIEDGIIQLASRITALEGK